jgi:predicted nucleotidyltransferase
MNDRDNQVLQEFTQQLRLRFPDAQVWAFGSRARGEAMPDSDLDVCVVLDQLDEQRDREISDIAWEVGFAHDMVISTVTFSRQEFTTGPLAVSPIVASILHDGVAV